MLRVEGVDAYYGDSHVLQGVSFAAGEGRVLGLIGRNGAGKSTCMNVAVGLLPARAGSVEVFGVAVTRLAPEQIAAQGVALVPQGRRVFKSLRTIVNRFCAAGELGSFQSSTAASRLDRSSASGTSSPYSS